MVKVYHDDGDGATEVSLDYFKTLKGKLGVIDSISIDADRLFTMEIRSHTEKDYELIITLLSGVSCGYRGTGPRGSQKIIEMLFAATFDPRFSITPMLRNPDRNLNTGMKVSGGIGWFGSRGAKGIKEESEKYHDINLLEHVLIEKEFEKGIIKW